MNEEVIYRRRRVKNTTTKTFRAKDDLKEAQLHHFSDIGVEEAKYYYDIFINGKVKVK